MQRLDQTNFIETECFKVCMAPYVEPVLLIKRDIDTAYFKSFKQKTKSRRKSKTKRYFGTPTTPNYTENNPDMSPSASDTLSLPNSVIKTP